MVEIQYICIYVCVDLYIYLYVYIHVCIYTYVHAHICVYILYMYSIYFFLSAKKISTKKSHRPSVLCMKGCWLCCHSNKENKIGAVCSL